MTIAVAAGVGYAIAAYRQGQTGNHIARTGTADEEDAQRKHRNELLEAAYGERNSLDSLEQAIKLYEEQRQNK